MSETTTAQASYYRKGKCAICGLRVERSRTFIGLSVADCEQQADAWYATPLRHRRCEIGTGDE